MNSNKKDKFDTLINVKKKELKYDENRDMHYTIRKKKNNIETEDNNNTIIILNDK